METSSVTSWLANVIYVTLLFPETKYIFTIMYFSLNQVGAFVLRMFILSSSIYVYDTVVHWWLASFAYSVVFVVTSTIQGRHHFDSRTSSARKICRWQNPVGRLHAVVAWTLQFPAPRCCQGPSRWTFRARWRVRRYELRSVTWSRAHFAALAL